MPREDEFNHVVVTNDRQLHGVEFGSAQNTEFSFNNVKRSGINTQPDNELNEGIQEVKETRKPKNVLEEEKDLIKQATESSNASAPTTAAPAGSGATTSSVAGAASSTAAATTAGSAVASTAAAAGTVVVAAFVVTTAAPIILSQATASLKELKVSENKVFYDLTLTDTLEDERYFVTLSNKTYEEKQLLEIEPEQESISGYFANLEPDVEYTFEVIEGDINSELTRSLLKKNLKTAAYAPVSQFKSVTVYPEANFVTGDFSIKLDFVDEKDLFSDFSLLLTDGEIEYLYSLDKVTTVQTRSLKAPEDSRFYYYGDFSYVFSYKEDGVTKSIQGETFTFTDISGAKSTLDGVSINPSVDFLDNKLSVTLSYTDLLENLYAFKLHLSYRDVTGGLNEQEYYLLTQTTAQIVETEEILPYEGTEFTYYATCEGLEGQLETEKKTITFTDSQNRQSVFNSATIDSDADFDNGLIYATLDFEDGFNRFDYVELELAENADSTYVYRLKMQTGKQSIDINDLESGGDITPRPPVISRGNTFSYTFRYYLKNSDSPIAINSGTVIFTDPSKFNYQGITFGYADFENSSVEVTINYTGSVDEVFALELELVDVNSQMSCNATLVKPYDTQYANMADGLDLEHGTFNYILRKYINEDYDYEVLEEGSNITFTDKDGRTSEVKDIIFEKDDSGKAIYNSAKGEFNITVDYTDYFGQYASLALVLIDNGGDAATGSDIQSWTFYLDLSDEIQSVEYKEYFNIVDDREISYTLQYSLVEDPEQLITAKEGKVTFKDTATPQVTGFEYGSVVSQDGSYYLPFKLTIGEKKTADYLSLRLFYSGQQGENIEVSTRVISDNTACYLDDYYQLCTLLISEDEIDNLLASTVTFDLCYTEENAGADDYTSLYSTTGRLSLDEGEFTPLGLRIPDYMAGGDMSFVINTFIYTGTYNPERDLHLKFVFQDDSTIYDDCYFNDDVFSGSFLEPYSLDINDQSLYRRISESNTFDLYIVYEDSDGVSHEVLCYKDFYFQV